MSILDASDKVRGFLFQDLVAINCLFEKETEYVCLEFLEDVNAFYKDSTLKFIQVKYYPKSNPNMNETMTDLYYQFLRTEILKLDLVLKLQLVIYGKDKNNIPDLAKMKTYVGTSKPARPKQRENPKEWLINEIYVLNKNEHIYFLNTKFNNLRPRVYVGSDLCCPFRSYSGKDEKRLFNPVQFGRIISSRWESEKDGGNDSNLYPDAQGYSGGGNPSGQRDGIGFRCWRDISPRPCAGGYPGKKRED